MVRLQSRRLVVSGRLTLGARVASRGRSLEHPPARPR
jgi:hypothetical protein